MVSLPSLAVVAAALITPQDPSPSPRDSTRLADVVVSASRAAPAARLRGSAADRLSSAELDARGLERLSEALRLAPATGIARTGAPGGVSASFLRGTNSGHTLMLVDGVRVNDANLLPGALLGGFELAPGDALEIVRGPQSTLYGGAAIGGVIAIGHDLNGREPARATLTAGGFGTYRGALSGTLTSGRLTVRAAGSLTDAENERPDNAFDQRTQVAGATFTASNRLTLGGTFRGMQQSYTSPGDIRTSNTTPVGRSDFENHLTTAYADLALTDRWRSRLTLGWQDYFLRGRSRFNGGPESVSRLGATRWVADWQHRIQGGRAVAIVAGLNAEWSTVGDGTSERDERLRAGYAEMVLTPTPDLAFSAGLRGDDYSTFGEALTGRLTAAWFVSSLSTRLRATVGTGFLPPSLSDRFGSAFQRPNPGIRPERSTGWDAGADVFLAGGRGVVGVTVFENRLRDLIGFEPAAFPELGRSINVARARTRGVELSGRLALDAVDLRAHYTRLDAESSSEPDPALRRLIRRPAHAVGADVVWLAHRRLELGGGFVAALDREDTDFNVFPFTRVDPGDYLDARLHARAALVRQVRVRVAVDNLFDERYEEVWGFPALGRRATVTLELTR